MGKPCLEISSHVYHHHMNGRLQAYEDMTHLELAFHFFSLFYDDVLK
jgi:CRISPR/Cas system-associated endonuclease Cas3-HD